MPKRVKRTHILDELRGLGHALNTLELATQRTYGELRDTRTNPLVHIDDLRSLRTSMETLTAAHDDVRQTLATLWDAFDAAPDETEG